MNKALFSMLFAVCAIAPAYAADASGDDLFKHGDFAAARAAYTAVLAKNPNDVNANVGLARVELYANNLNAAEAPAKLAHSLDANNAAADRVLSTINQRRGVLKSADALSVPPGGVTIPFLATDPLPLLQMQINGHTANLLLDTGGPDLTLDPDFAHELGLTVTGGETGTFAGGRTAQVQHAKVQTINAGGVMLHDLAVTILPSRNLPFFGQTRVDGVVGTVFLSRFLATIDYPNKRLILMPRGTTAPSGSNSTVIPMWLVGDHFVFATGSVNALSNQLFLIDSGGAGVGFSPEPATIEAAHLKTFPDQAQTGMGGGGPVKFIPIQADKVCLLTACQSNVGGMYTPAGSPLSIFPFSTAGVVSHEFLKHYAVTFDFQTMRLILS